MKTNIILLLLLSLFSLSACDEQGLWENSNDVTYIYFSKDATKDSTATSFKLYAGENRITIPVEVTVAGKWPKQDIEFTVSVDLNETTLYPENYVIPEKFVYRADHKVDTIYIDFINHPDLATKDLRLVLKIDPKGDILEGPVINQRAIISITDRIFQPEWWTVWDFIGTNGQPLFNIAEAYYIGEYSDTKYLMFLDILDGEPFDGKDRNKLRGYCLQLKYKIEEFNNDPANIAAGKTPLKDEKGRVITVPIKG